MIYSRFLIKVLPLLSGVNLFSQQSVEFFDGTDTQTYCIMEKAERQIEEVRKGNFVLEFTDENGNQVNAEAVIELKSHDFDFGANLFGFYSMSDDNPAKATALKAIDSLFNTVIVVDYWGTNQSRLNGSLNWASPDYGFSIAKELRKKTRYHALLFGYPRWFDGFTSEEMWGIIEERIKNVADRYGDLISEVDVINEFINYQYWDQNPNAIYLKTTNYPDFAKPDNGLRALELAKKYLPNAKLVVLETNIWSVKNPVFQEIYNYHKSLIELGAPEYYIGYQAHYYAQGMPFQQGTAEFGPRTYMMDEINKGIEQMAGLGKPMVITEFNPPSRNNQSTNPNQPGLTDEEIAAWERNFYTLMFSKSYIHGVSRWFTIDNLGGKGMDAGVVTEEGELKPNYFALMKLIKEKWTTKWEGNIKDKVAFKGFYGTYLVQINGKESFDIELTDSSRSQTVIVR